jgi:hypothetical protein
MLLEVEVPTLFWEGVYLEYLTALLVHEIGGTPKTRVCTICATETQQ